MNPCPKCGQSRMSSPAYCPGDGSCGIVGCFGSEHLTSRCSCGYAKKSPTADARRTPPPFDVQALIDLGFNARVTR